MRSRLPGENPAAGSRATVRPLAIVAFSGFFPRPVLFTDQARDGSVSVVPSGGRSAPGGHHAGV